MCLFGGIWTLVLWIIGAVECFKHCLMGHTGRSTENRDAKSYLNCWGLIKEDSEKNFSVLPRNHSCDILVNEVATFCPCPKSLPKAKVKSFRLIPLAEEISKQCRIHSVLGLLVFMLIKISNEKEQVEQSKLQNVSFKEKKSTM